VPNPRLVRGDAQRLEIAHVGDATEQRQRRRADTQRDAALTLATSRSR